MLKTKNKKPKVFMMCGISGSGKTCFSKQLELYGVHRLSLDEELWPDYFILSDMISREHRDFLFNEAIKRIKSRIFNLCSTGRPCSIDMPFCKKAQREDFRAYIESCGGEPVLVWIDADISVLKTRLAERTGKNGPNNLPVSEEKIEMFLLGFERPADEEHTKIDGTSDFDIERFAEMI